MGNQLTTPYTASRLGALIHPVKTASQESPQLPLHHIVLISRILFAVIVIGLIGYFFDRMMLSLKPHRNNIIWKTRASSRCNVIDSYGG